MGWSLPSSGLASLTHYDLPLNYLASCGCSTVSTNYPTAAISSLAYSGKSAYTLGAGPGCGRCFKITLISAHAASPPFVLADRPDKPIPSVVVKIVDKCPSPEYCSATETTKNKLGVTVHFDLALPSPALNLSFFPSDLALYGYEDFGVWNVNYESISCENWAGWKNQSALGTDPNYPASDSLCCPYNPAFVESPHDSWSPPFSHLRLHLTSLYIMVLGLFNSLINELKAVTTFALPTAEAVQTYLQRRLDANGEAT